MARSRPEHLSSSKDLETTYEAIRAGFVELALEKNRQATPFVAEARALKALAGKAASPLNLTAIQEIRRGLLAAAGLSDKAAGHMQQADKDEAIQGLIRNFLEPAGSNFVEELVFRFLLNRGDTLGGSMRNVGGFIAQKKLSRAVLAVLKIAGRGCQWLQAPSNVWTVVPEQDADIELNLRGLSWESANGPRTLLYNLTIPFLGNNVDLCLFNSGLVAARSEQIKNPAAYLALGELKGGIDPAGADEHWKTARSALNRIAEAFPKRRNKPKTFFIGAAIESRMAEEIWTLLQRSTLSNAANLTNDNQIAAIASWLCTL